MESEGAADEQTNSGVEPLHTGVGKAVCQRSFNPIPVRSHLPRELHKARNLTSSSPQYPVILKLHAGSHGGLVEDLP